ncbi:MAG: hypothetical protein IJF96_01650 [Firmicutes bacterium]|nr:hypothetical protein [Bacillota bacterium]
MKMTYMEAYYGVKKVFIAQVLAAITALAGIAAAAIEANAGQGDGKAAEVLASFGGILLILTIVSYILSLIGLKQAARNEPFFRTAFTISLLGLVCSLGGGVLSAIGYESAQSIAEFANQMLQIMIIIYVIYGIISLAGKLKDEKLEQNGKRLVMLITVLLFISIIISLMADMFSKKAGEMVVGAVGIVSALLLFVSYVLYLILLGRAVKTLGEK